MSTENDELFGAVATVLRVNGNTFYPAKLGFVSCQAEDIAERTRSSLEDGVPGARGDIYEA